MGASHAAAAGALRRDGAPSGGPASLFTRPAASVPAQRAPLPSNQTHQRLRKPARRLRGPLRQGALDAHGLFNAASPPPRVEVEEAYLRRAGSPNLTWDKECRPRRLSARPCTDPLYAHPRTRTQVGKPKPSPGHGRAVFRRAAVKGAGGYLAQPSLYSTGEAAAWRVLCPGKQPHPAGE